MRDLLETGLDKLGLATEAALCNALLAYIELLQKWNKAYNLTAVKDPVEIINRHVFDSLSVLPFINGQRYLDIGTGAGLPGLMLAMAQQGRHWVLLDSNQKKLRFLRHVITELNISNVELVHSRVEQYKPEEEFDGLICRAFAPLPRMLEQVEHLITDDNCLLAMKGKQIVDEVMQLSKDKFQIEVHEIPFLSDESAARLVQIRRSGTGI